MTASPNVVIDVDPFSRECLADPYPAHEKMREAGPAFKLAPYDLWCCARHAEVVEIFNDWRAYSSAAGVGLSNFRTEKPWRPPSLLLEADPPAHSRPRGILTRILSPVVVRSMRGKLQQDANELIDRLVAKATFDGAGEIAQVYPLKVLCDEVGLGNDGRANLLKYAAIGFATFGPRNWIWEEVMPNFPTLHAWVMANCERKALATDGLGAQIYAAADSGEITEDEARMLVRTFLSAGVDTVVNAVSNLLVAIAQHPDQWALLRADPLLIRNAFEESLRYESAIQMFFRTTTREVSIGGICLGEGEKILLSLGAANRDPRKWPNPNQFDIRRATAGHVAFGVGVHGCLGQMLARLQGEAILTAMLARIATIELTGEPTVSLNNTSRGYASIPLRVRMA